MISVLKYFIILLLFPALWVFPAHAFNLSATVSGSGGSWSDGVYVIAPNVNLTFSCTATNGTPNYSWEWEIDDEKAYRSPATNKSGSGDADGVLPNVVRDFDYPGFYEVWIRVVDDGGDLDTHTNVEKALLRIQVTDGLTIKNAIDDCSMTDDNSTDNTSALNTCISGAGSTYRIYFPNSDTGIYKFNTTQSAGASKTVIADVSGDTKIEFFGDVGVEFDVNSAVDGFYYATNTSSTQYVYSRNIYFNMTSGPLWETQTGSDLGEAGRIIFENCKFYSTNIYRGNVRIKKSIATNYPSNFLYPEGYTYLGYNYIADNVASASHILYYQPNDADRSYHYIIKNFFESSPRDVPKNVMQLKPSSGVTNFYSVYVIGNMHLFTTAQAGEDTKMVEFGRGDVTSMDDVKFNDNRHWGGHDSGTGYALLFSLNGSGNITNTEIKRNFFSKVELDVIALCGDGAITITDNVFGYDAASDAGEGKIAEGDGGLCLGAGDQYTETGSVDDTTKYMGGGSHPLSDPSGWYDNDGYIDPGEWEYTPPTNNGDSATDSGSGMGSSARFPFQEGAIAQACDASNNFSQIVAYASRDDLNSWPQIRYADVDHNWSSLSDSAAQPKDIEGLIIE
jgi:hypothetical protein